MADMPPASFSGALPQPFITPHLRRKRQPLGVIGEVVSRFRQFNLPQPVKTGPVLRMRPR
jgi:hypothetical protein